MLRANLTLNALAGSGKDYKINAAADGGFKAKAGRGMAALEPLFKQGG